MNHPTAAPRTGRRARLAATAGLAAALAIGAPAAAQAEEALPTDGQAPQTVQAAQEQVALPTTEGDGATEVPGPADSTVTEDVLEPAGTDGAEDAPKPAGTASTTEHVDAGGTVESASPETDAPSDATESVVPSESDAAVEPTEETEPGDTTEATGENGADNTAESVDGSTTDAAGSASGSMATLAAEGSEGAADPTGEGDADVSLDQDEPGELTLLEGEGFSYAVLTGEEGLEEGVLNAFHVGDKSAFYYGPGAYVWIDEDITSFSMPAQLDGAPVVGVGCEGGSLESLDLTAAASTLLYLDCGGTTSPGST